MNRTAKRAIACACLVLPLVVMTVVRAQVQAPKDGQGKYLTLAGYRHGPSAFTRNFLVETTPLQPGVMDFKHYHTYTETGGVPQEVGEGLPGPGRSLRRRPELRRHRHLPGDA